MTNGHSLPTITCRDLREVQEEEKKHLIIDVREPADYEAGHVEGSIHMPFAELETNIPSIVHDKKELVVVVGERADQAEETYAHLTKSGYQNAKFLLGGFDEWCKPATPDIADIVEDARDEAEISEDRTQHGEDKDGVEQGAEDEPLM